MPRLVRSRGAKRSAKKPAKKSLLGFLFRVLFTHWKIIFKTLLIVVAIGAVVAVYAMHRLDRIIAEKFDQTRKWNLPSRVYSDADYLYPGINITEHQLIAKLDRLSYRDTKTAIAAPGDYARLSSSIDIFLHDFDYPEGPFSGFPVRLELNGEIVQRIINLHTQETLDVVKLEPEMVGSIFDERMEDRTVVRLSDVSPRLLEAIIAIEDERFFQHHGVDPSGIARAALKNLMSLRVVQGGSTLTQQLVKNYFLKSERTLWRKINEALMALQLERRYSKGQILQAYINEIYLGQRGSSSIAGVAEAAKYYFAKNVGQLSLAENAQLAGMIRSPNMYNPHRDVEKARVRRNVVLARMREQGLITDQEFVQAKNEPIIAPKPRVRHGTAPYFIDFVKQQLAEFYPQEVLQSEGLRIFTTLDMTLQLLAEDVVSKELPRLEQDNAKVLPKDRAGQLQTCLLAISPSNGSVRAMVGGRRYSESQFNRCVQALRQPGSTFKPFVYLTAMDPARSEKLFTPASLIDDRTFAVQSGGELWSPKNYDKKEHGMITVRTALEQSYNIATARLAIDAGLEGVVQTARDAGINSPLMAVPAIALGAFEVTPLEMATAYTIFPNSGIRAEPVSILQVVTKEGKVLERKHIRLQRQFDPGPVYLTTNIMKGVIDRGTGASARSLGVTGSVAGKTGTTSNYRDAWFVGFSPQLLALAWVGYDDNVEMHLSGGRGALPIWAQFMKRAEMTSAEFAVPTNVNLVKIDPRTGGLNTFRCPAFIYEAFLSGTEPNITCDNIDLNTVTRK